MKHKFGSLLAISGLVASLFIPSLSQAATPFSLESVVGYVDDANTSIPLPEDSMSGGNPVAFHDGDVIDRDVKRLTIGFTHALNFPSAAYAVSLTDSQGHEVSMITDYGMDNESYLKINEPLHRNESYTLKIKGGVNGVKDKDGAMLPADVEYKLHTKDVGLYKKVQLSNYFDRMNQLQVNSFTFHAEQGASRVRVWGVPRGAAMYLRVLDASSRQGVYEGFMESAQEQTFTLPSSGEYQVTVAPVGMNMERMNHSIVALKALELDVQDPNSLTLTMRDIGTFELFDKKVDLGLHVLESTKDVFVGVDGKELGTFKPSVEGNFDPIVIDPSTLKDGIHTVTVDAQKLNSNNSSSIARQFLVDRVDSYTDVPHSRWSHRSIEVMSHLGVLNGRGDQTFQPDKPVTREEFAKMLSVTLRLNALSPSSVQFVDVVGTRWSKSFIDQLATAGLITGESVNGQSYFYPERTISREEAATIIGRFLKVSNRDVSMIESFSDLKKTQLWAKSSVVVLNQIGWINGYNDGTFRPQNTLSREETAKLISNFLGMQ